MPRALVAGRSWRTQQRVRSHQATLPLGWGSSFSLLMPRVGRASSNRAGQLSQTPSVRTATAASLAPKGLPLYP